MPSAFSLTAALSMQLTAQSVRNIRSQLDKAFSGFELKIEGLRTLGSSLKDISAIRREVNSLSQSLGIQAKELASAAQGFKSLGMSARDVSTSLRAVGQASKLPGFGSVASTASAASAALRGFRLSADQLKGAFDSIHSMSQRYGTDASRMLDSISHLASGFAKKKGTLNEMVALLATARNETGLSEQEISGSLHHAFGRLSRPDTQRRLSQLGINLRDSKGQYAGHFEALQRISAGLSGLSPLDARYQNITSQLGGVRRYQQLVGFLTSAKQAREALTLSELNAYGIEEKSSHLLDTWSGRMSQLEEKFSAMQRTLLGSPFLKNFADGALSAADGVGKLVSALQPLIPLAVALGATSLLKTGFGALGGLRTATGALNPRLFTGTALATGALIGSLPAYFKSNDLARESEDTQRGFVTGSGITSGVSGALLGGVGGSVFGPWGAAIGAAVGGLYSFTQGLKAAEQELEQAKFTKLEGEISDRIRGLSSGAVSLTPGRSVQAAEDLKTLESEARRKAVGVANEKGIDYYTALQGQRKEIISPLISGFIVAGTKQIESAAHVQGATAQGVYRQFSASPLGAALMPELQRLGKSADEVTESFTKLAAGAVREAQAQAANRRIQSSEAASVHSLDLLSKGLSGAAIGLQSLEGRAKLLSEAFAGNAGMISRPNLSHSLAIPGTAAFSQAASQLVPMLGNYGPAVSGQLRSVSELKRVLPSILSEASRSGSPLEGESIQGRIADALSGNKSILPEHRNVIENQLSLLASGQGGESRILDKLSHGVDAFAAELSNPVANPVLSALKLMGETLERRAGEIDSAAHQYEQGIRQVIASQSQLGQLRLNSSLFQARVRAEQMGRPSDFLSLVPLSAMNAPFQQNQEALTGLKGGAALSPNSIAGRLRQSLEQAEALRTRRDRSTPGSAESLKLASEFAHTQSSVMNLRQALVNLTDVAKQTASAEQRLAVIEQDRASRQNFGEHFLGSDIHGRMQMLRGQALVGIAARQGGNIGNMTVGQQQLVMNTLGSLGNARLTTLGGISAADLKRQVVERTTGIKLDRNSEAERKNLLGQIGEAHNRAIAAQTALVALEQHLQTELYQNLERTNSKFLEDFKQILLGQKVAGIDARMGSIRGQLGELQSPGFQLLRKLGINQQELSLLQHPNNQKLLEEYASKTRDANQQKAILGNLPAKLPFAVNAQKIASFVSNGRGFEMNNIYTNEQIEHLGGILGRVGVDEKLAPAVLHNLKNLYGTRQGVAGLLGKDVPELLPEAIRQAQARKVETTQIGAARAANQLGDNTNIGGDKLEKVLSEYVNNTKRFSDALANIHDIANLVNSIKALTAQLKGAEGEKAATQLPGVARNRLFGHFADGGSVRYFGEGGRLGPSNPAMFQPRGTDTVPAMLTPGEYVVPAFQAKKYHRLLEMMRSGSLNLAHFADGGEVSYMDGGGYINPFVRSHINQEVLRHNFRNLSPIGQQLRLYWLQRNAAIAQHRAMHSRYRPGRPVGDATSLDELRRRESYHNGREEDYLRRQARIEGDEQRERQRAALGRIGAAHRRRYGVPVASASSFTRISPNAPPVRHFAEGGSVDAGFAGTANMLAKAMEGMPRSIEMSGQHVHQHHHFGLEVIARAEPAFRKIAEDIVSDKLLRFVNRNFGHAGLDMAGIS